MQTNHFALDLIAFGRGTIDLVIAVDALPSHDQKVMGRMVGWLPGGTIPNFACAASLLGLRVGFLGVVGGDAHAQAVRDDLARFGVRTDHLEQRAGVTTNFCVVLVDPSGEKAIVVVPTDPSPVTLDASARAYLETARVVYLMPHDLVQLRALAAVVRPAGGKIALDIEATDAVQGAALSEMLSHADIAIFNQEGLAIAVGVRDPRTAARELLQAGPEVVVVTRGAQGSLAVTRSAETEHPGFVVPVVDTTGAGDCFNAAFLRGYISGEALTRCVLFANAAAALSVTRLGPRAAIPTAGEVEAFLAQYASRAA